MNDICKLRNEIAEMEDSLVQRRSRGKTPFRDRSSSPELNREWRYERNRVQGEINNEEHSHHSDMQARERRQRKQRRESKESPKDRYKRFERVRDILRKEERNRIKREIVMKLLQRIDAVSFKERRTFNWAIRNLRYKLLYISTPSENVEDGRRYYRI